VPEGDFTAEPQVVLDKPEQYTSLAGYNPATEHLMWRGPSDVSAKIWFRRDGDTLAIRAEVTDDITRLPAADAIQAGDAMVLAFMAGDVRHLEWVTSADGHVYEKTFSLSQLGCSPGDTILFNTQVRDNDDGNGNIAEGFIGVSADLTGNNAGEWAELEL